MSTHFYLIFVQLNLKNAMDSLHEKVPDLLPQQGTYKNV